jgi:outer membrane receptor protein involved in Fe transport
MRFILILLVLILSASKIWSQPAGYGESESKGSISGYIKDNETNKGIEYANIAVYSAIDSSVVNGAMADRSGYFLIDGLKSGKYFVDVDFIGYRKKRINKISITQKNKKINLGHLTIEKSITKLNEVEITAEKKLIEYKIDKKVINVGKDIINENGNAVDILENTPSVETDIDGNVSLRGSSSFTVLIDGKPTILDGSDALQQIPTSNIEEIEIITNPSAKYDPDGTAGIINVILKKKQEKGMNGIINASVGTYDNYSADGIFNYRLGKINLFAGVDYRNRMRPGGGISKRESYQNDTIYYFDKDMDRSRGRNGYNFKGGIEYDLNKNNFFSIEGEYGKFGFRMVNDANNHSYSDPAFSEDYYITDNDFDVANFYYNINAFFQHKFKEKGHELSGSLYFSDSEGDDTEDLLEYITDSDWNKLETDPDKQQSTERDFTKKYRIKLDYIKPVGMNGKFEAGAQARIYNKTSDYKLDLWDYDAGDWVNDASLNNNINFDRQIHSAYTTFSNVYHNFEFMLGFRMEYTDRLITQNVLNENYIVNRFDYFPTIHVSRKITESQQVQASYSRRIDRPREYFLDPFPNFSDQQTMRMGNPELEPEYTDSYELNYQLSLKKGSFISLETYYRQTNNLINRILYIDTNNVMVRTFDNINRDFSIGVELMGNINVFKWWTVNASVNLFNYNIDGEVLEEEVNQTMNTWRANLSQTFKLKTKTSIQLRGSYSAPSITAQGNRAGYYHTSAAIKQSFYDGKLSASFRITDIFGTHRHAFTSSGDNFYIDNDFYGIGQQFSISISYKINNYQRKKDSNMDEMDYDGGDM